MKNASIALLCEMHRQLGEVVVQLVEQFSLPELQKKHILEELSSSAVGVASVGATPASVASVTVSPTVMSPLSASVTVSPTVMSPLSASVTVSPTAISSSESSPPIHTPGVTSTIPTTPSQSATATPSLTSLLDPVDVSNEVLHTPCFHRRSKPSFPP